MTAARNTVGAALGFLVGLAGASALGDEPRRIELPDSIYMSVSDDAALDQDADGLKDDDENRLADAWRPYFVFDQNENSRQHCSTTSEVVKSTVEVPCAVVDTLLPGELCHKVVEKTVEKTVCKDNVDDDSLRPFEPVVIFQVRPKAGDDWPRRVSIHWAFLYRLDGGYRESNVCTNYHYGDSQSGDYELVSDDGILWTLDTLKLWSGKDKVPATSAEISWTAPRATYWGQLPDRPSPKIFASAGKHHQYISAQACEDEPGACDDDCGGGQERLSDLTPKGAFTNVGELQTHPGAENFPFVTELGPIGFPGERVWEAVWDCTCPLATTAAECFTGGLGKDWTASKPPQGCDMPTPVYKLFDLQPVSRPPLELGAALTVLLYF